MFIGTLSSTLAEKCRDVVRDMLHLLAVPDFQDISDTKGTQEIFYLLFPLSHFSTRSLKIMDFILQWLNLERKGIVYVDMILFLKVLYNFKVIK